MILTVGKMQLGIFWTPPRPACFDTYWMGKKIQYMLFQMWRGQVVFWPRGAEKVKEQDPVEDLVQPRPCVGCGYCCKKVQCGLSIVSYGRKSVCPALYECNGRYWCLMADDYPEVLAIGAGCCSPLNSARREHLQKVRHDRS